MTSEPNLRDRAIDAAKQAINTLGTWLPPAGREAAVDAILALTAPEACCVCGGGPVTYRNYRDLPFCWPCADCQCAQNPCVRTGVNDPAVSAEAASYCPHCGRGDAGPTADQYEASQRRAVRIQQLLDDQRDRPRKDAAASRESERQLQQQIDRQAKEIDRLRDDYRKANSTLIKVTAQAMADPPLEQFMDDEPTEYAQGWAAAMSRVDAALEPPKEQQ